MNQAPCNKIKSFIDDQIENQKELLKPKLPGVTIKPGIQERHFDIAYLETMYQRYFRCGFKATFSGDRRKSRNFFFTEDEAPRRASNHGQLCGNYRDKYLLTTGDGQLHANLR